MTARVIWWNSDRGHGMLRNAHDEDIFVHHTALAGPEGAEQWKSEINLRQGQQVEFDAVAGTVGTVAANVRVIE